MKTKNISFMFLLTAFLGVGCSNDEKSIMDENCATIKINGVSKIAIDNFIHKAEGNIELVTRNTVVETSLRRYLSQFRACAGKNGNCIDDVIITPSSNEVPVRFLMTSWESSTEAIALQKLEDSGTITKEIVVGDSDKVFYIYKSESLGIELEVPLLAE